MSLRSHRSMSVESTDGESSVRTSASRNSKSDLVKKPEFY